MQLLLNELLKTDFRKYENKDYVFTKVDGKFVAVTYGDFLRKADRFAKFLLSEGFANKKIMVYGENSVAWMVADLAIVGFVGSSIGAPAAWKTDDMDNEISHLGIDCVLFSKSKAEYMKPVMEHYPEVKYYPLEMAVDGSLEVDMSLGVDDLFNMPLRPYEACAKVVFSSGTTSFPKAVMLSQKGMFCGKRNFDMRSPFFDTDVMYTFLPFSHTYGGIYNFYYSLMYGFQLYLASSVSAIYDELLEINPTVFCAVPLNLMKILEKNGEEEFIHAYGNRLRHLFVGGSKIDRRVKKLYKDKGIDLIEAYALSETSSSFSFEFSHDPEIESTGTVFDDIEVDIRNPDEQGRGEIYCRGDAIFLGYMNEPGVTATVLSEDGWFKTGDIGYMDENRHLFLTGRSKKLLLTANGENINDEKIIAQIKAAVPEVTCVKVFLMQDKLTSYIYVPNDELKKLDWDAIIADINSKNARYDAVKVFKVFKDSLDIRLKQ